MVAPLCRLNLGIYILKNNDFRWNIKPKERFMWTITQEGSVLINKNVNYRTFKNAFRANDFKYYENIAYLNHFNTWVRNIYGYFIYLCKGAVKGYKKTG